MRVTVVDPPAYTPPYDHALCAALARRGLDVELVTSHFRFGAVPPAGLPARGALLPGGARQRGGQGVQHPFDMARLARSACAAPRAEIVHFQWLPIPALDRRCWCACFRARWC